jgi:membrane-associated phospholipid phosphatase
MLSFTIAAIIFIHNKQLGTILGVLGLLVGFSRVFAKIHHPLDIFGSIVIAITATCLGYQIAKRVKWPSIS